MSLNDSQKSSLVLDNLVQHLNIVSYRMMLLHILDANANCQEQGNSKSQQLCRKASQGCKVMGRAGGGRSSHWPGTVLCYQARRVPMIVDRVIHGPVGARQVCSDDLGLR